MLCLYLEVFMIAFSPSFIEFDDFKKSFLWYIFVLLAIFLIHMYMACNEVWVHFQYSVWYNKQYKP